MPTVLPARRPTTTSWQQAVNRAQAHLATLGYDATFTIDDAEALGIPHSDAVIVIAILEHIGFLHPTHTPGVLARRPDLPALGLRGHIWERLWTPSGDQIQIVGERAKPDASRLQQTTRVRWLCTACSFTAPGALRLLQTRERAYTHILHCPAGSVRQRLCAVS